MSDDLEFKGKIRKVGNSYGLIIPKDIIDKIPESEREKVNIKVNVPVNKEAIKTLSPEKLKLLKDLIKQGIVPKEVLEK